MISSPWEEKEFWARYDLCVSSLSLPSHRFKCCESGFISSTLGENSLRLHLAQVLWRWRFRTLRCLSQEVKSVKMLGIMRTETSHSETMWSSMKQLKCSLLDSAILRHKPSLEDFWDNSGTPLLFAVRTSQAQNIFNVAEKKLKHTCKPILRIYSNTLFRNQWLHLFVCDFCICWCCCHLPCYPGFKVQVYSWPNLLIPSISSYVG